MLHIIIYERNTYIVASSIYTSSHDSNHVLVTES